MLMEVTCRCGWVTRGTKSEVIASVQAHGRTAHQLDVTPAEVRAIWRMVETPGPKK
ncbi:MAG TPA: DUF1059 domain-containing protein [Candidatus Dormibacteraeota bacterium]|nr:DUF1059 domain-containing protein [Candidatus Dormibacteraeota bacterium]